MSNCWRTHVSARRIANPPQLAKLPHKPHYVIVEE